MNSPFLILLFLIGSVTALGSHSESSCEEQSQHELVCSDEVREVIRKEHPDLHIPKPKKKIADIETTPAPPERPEEPEKPVDGGEYDYQYADDY